MVNALEILPMSWLANHLGEPERIVVIALRMDGGDAYWLINGRREEHWTGIPLTPELMSKLGWEKATDRTLLGEYRISGYRTLDHFMLCFFYEIAPATNEERSIVAGPAATKIEYLHELQRLYLSVTGNLLTVNL